MIKIFCCPSCKTSLQGWPPSLNCTSCGHTIQKTEEGILLFTDEPNLNLEGNRTYVGYDPVAEGYAQYAYPEEINKQIFIGYGKTIAELVGPGSFLLDIGCGPGSYDLETAKRSHRIIAGDISLSMLKILSSKLQDVPEYSIIPCRLNAYNLPLLNQSADAVIAMQLLAFVGDPSQVISEIKRVLKPGGIFITTYGVSDSAYSNDHIVGEINMKIRRYYSEEMKKRGVTEMKTLGWGSNRQMQENLPKFFRNHRVVASDDLVFRYIATPKQWLRTLASRYTMFQVVLDQKIHDEAIREVRNRLASEYGEGFEEIKQECCWMDRLNVYSD